MDASRVFFVSVSEAAAALASPTAQVQVIGVMAETASASDLVSAIRTANVSVTGVQLFISIGGALVWAVVDDTQNPSWQNVDNAQGTVWMAVGNTQNPSWQNVNDTQTPGWQNVNDTQNPGWNNLPS
jgi:hypothetical protein